MRLDSCIIATTTTMIVLFFRNATGFSSRRYAAIRTTTTTTTTLSTTKRRNRRGVCCFAEPNIPPQAVQQLLRGTLSRAKRTLSEKDGAFANDDNNDIDNGSSQLLDLFGGTSVSVPSPSQRSDAAKELLAGITSQAKRTLSTRSELYDAEVGSNQTVSTPSFQTFQKSDTAKEPLSGITNQAKRKLSTKTEIFDAVIDQTSSTTTTISNKSNQEPATTPNDIIITPTDLRYNQNPALSLTSLAQWLWASVLRPHKDTAIDATCGNGHDSAGIARILMGNENLYLDHKAELICIDIQPEACQVTREKLANILYPSTMKKHVQILTQSHASLPVPSNPSSVGLVVYNLGYLPNSNDKALQTRVDSTLSSIADALLLVRIGGMVSVMTYPGSNAEEDFAVRSLFEAVVNMTNKQGPKWYEFVDQLDCNSAQVRELLTKELRRISSANECGDQQPRTFRISEHKKIGLAQAPILLTATRIK